MIDQLIPLLAPNMVAMAPSVETVDGVDVCDVAVELDADTPEDLDSRRVRRHRVRFRMTTIDRDTFDAISAAGPDVDTVVPLLIAASCRPPAGNLADFAPSPSANHVAAMWADPVWRDDLLRMLAAVILVADLDVLEGTVR